jgi:hypothetical protein
MVWKELEKINGALLQQSYGELRAAITAMYRMSLWSPRTSDVQEPMDTKLPSN